MKSYRDHIATGELDEKTAAIMEATRGTARLSTRHMLTPIGDLPVDAAAFGMLDVVAVKMVDWYGAAEAAEVFAHYAETCRNRVGK